MKTLLTTTLLLCLASHGLLGQATATGYANRVDQLPVSSGQTLVLAEGTVYFTGTELILRDGSGANRTLLKFNAPVWGSFTTQVRPDALLFGESKNSELWLVPLAIGGTPKMLSTVPFNYAATAYNADWALVSARTGGFSAPDNDILAVNLNTGVLDPIATIPGASGPLVLDRSGNLLYATASPILNPPKGSVDLLQFDAARVTGAFGSGKLDRSDAAVVFSGLDAAGSIALDDDHDVFLTDWKNGTIVEISDVHTASPRRSIMFAYPSTLTASAVQFVSGHRTGAQEFEPFQPSGAGTLWIHESEYNVRSQLTSLTPQRATTQANFPSPIPSGRAFEVRIDGAAPGGTAYVALGLGAGRREVAVSLIHEQTVFWSDALLMPILITPLSLDSTGSAKVNMFNPGFATPLVLTYQSFFVDQAGVDAGSSEPLEVIVR